MHNWEIRPHRHATLIQMLLIETGQAHVEIDERELELRGPAVVWVPSFVVHGFGFAAETQGLVVTMEPGWLRDMLSGAEGLWEELRHSRALALRRSSAPLRALQAASTGLKLEYASTQAWRSLMLNSAAATLAACIGRLPRLVEVAPLPSGAKGRSLLHLARFREQVDRVFRSQPSLAELTEPLGVTTTQMNRLCRQYLQCSALDVLHQRLLLEAKRELGYTTLQVRQISDRLGFSDPAYFTRFFQRLAGLSPKAWREKAQAACA
ncbi:MAG: helix-turn-helix domain-containing protein [Burkholderiaceae bacterium]|nr:helix-turn-helix domain-containing protein [Roseateles sp.]MBV8468659.1 helix-turn-helix domain-containing protein [Burkholderiaceae bacterium]